MISTSLLFSLLATAVLFVAFNANAESIAYNQPMCEPNPVVMTVQRSTGTPFAVQAPCQNELKASTATAPVMGEFSVIDHSQYEPTDVEGADANMFAPKN